MTAFLHIALVGLVPIFQICGATSESSNDLLAVVQVLRDCHRSPLLFYPNDPYNNQSVWPVPAGFLTKLGYQQCKALGQSTRQRYDSFLPKEFSDDLIRARSINLHRCELSAQSVLQGMFSDDGTADDIWYNEFPVESVDQRVFGAAPDCMIYSTELSNVLINGEWFYDMNAEYSDVFAYIENSTGSNIESVMGVYSIADTLMTEEVYGFTLPDWTEPVYEKPMLLLGGYALKALSYTDIMKKLTIGAWYQTIIEYFEEVIAGTATETYQLFSGEATNLATILNTIGAFNLTIPPFGSSLYLELRNISNEFVINFWYKHGDELEPISVMCCAFNCPLTRLKQLLTPFLIYTKDYEDYCSSSNTVYTNLNDTSQSDELEDVHKECVVVINSQRKDPLTCTNEVLKK